MEVRDHIETGMSGFWTAQEQKIVFSKAAFVMSWKHFSTLYLDISIGLQYFATMYCPSPFTVF